MCQLVWLCSSQREHRWKLVFLFSGASGIFSQTFAFDLCVFSAHNIFEWNAPGRSKTKPEVAVELLIRILQMWQLQVLGVVPHNRQFHYCKIWSVFLPNPVTQLVSCSVESCGKAFIHLYDELLVKLSYIIKGNTGAVTCQTAQDLGVIRNE